MFLVLSSAKLVILFPDHLPVISSKIAHGVWLIGTAPCNKSQFVVCFQSGFLKVWWQQVSEHKILSHRPPTQKCSFIPHKLKSVYVYTPQHHFLCVIPDSRRYSASNFIWCGTLVFCWSMVNLYSMGENDYKLYCMGMLLDWRYFTFSKKVFIARDRAPGLKRVKQLL